jgi:hypothetical protein
MGVADSRCQTFAEGGFPVWRIRGVRPVCLLPSRVMTIADCGKSRGIQGGGGMDWIAHVTEALFSMYRGASKLPDEILAVEGYSSPWSGAC